MPSNKERKVIIIMNLKEHLHSHNSKKVNFHSHCIKSPQTLPKKIFLNRRLEVWPTDGEYGIYRDAREGGTGG